MQTSHLLISLLLLGQPAVPAAASPPTASLAEEPTTRAAALTPDDPAQLEFFEKKIRPILVQRCFECHSDQEADPSGGLRLDSRPAILTGGDSGPAAVPGDPERSLFMRAIHYDDENVQMPPEGKLPAAEIDLLTEWIRRGVPFTPTEVAATARRTVDLDAGRQHWAFQPVHEHPLPAAAADGASEQRIDRFVLAKLHEQRLAPSPRADRRVLIRRLKFDLLGLPPTPEEIAAFADDTSPDAYERLVDHYLASPQHGERWGRYWLDLARYADVVESWRRGDARAWLYRDWVVSALNADMPYDEFVRRQLAADLLPGATPADNSALGFLGLSPSYWKELKLDHKVIKQVVAEEWEERIEAFGATFLGLTIACARCHDHKFDPVTAQDYYALAGVLASSRLEDRPIIAAELATPAQKAREQVKELEKQIATLKKAKNKTEEQTKKLAELPKQIDELKQTPHYDTPLAFAVSEARIEVLPDGDFRTKIEFRPGEAMNVALHIRGNAANPGKEVPRRYLSVLADDPADTFDEGSGRLELADAIFADSGPLAARVIVNRVWQHHFGRGLVTTPSNFGTTAEPPSHSQLLDDLAARFMAKGWSFKWLHREIVLSATYQQSSQNDSAREAVDPENIWLWRMKPKRLDVEAWRDAMLATSGRLDRTLGGDCFDLTKAGNNRRTIYGEVKRRELSDLLRLHDFPDPVSHSAHREPTTTPLQQLFAFNSPFMHEQSTALAARLDEEELEEPGERIERLYRLLFGRQATDSERSLGETFVLEVEQSGIPAAEAWRQYCHALLSSNEFLFVD